MSRKSIIWNFQGFGHLALTHDQQRDKKLLILPPLLHENHLMRHMLVDMMGALDKAGIDSFLPDIPAMNESFFPQEQCDFGLWTDAMSHFAENVVIGENNGGKTALLVLHFRLSAMIKPALPHATHMAIFPELGQKYLRHMMRTLALQEKRKKSDDWRDNIMANGIEYQGFFHSPALLQQLHNHDDGGDYFQRIITLSGHKQSGHQDNENIITGQPLWRRTEAGYDEEQIIQLTDMVTEHFA